jgi:hypothetical protein
MLPNHERVARIGLAAISQYGFVLAGGYALSENGIGDRLSHDVDLFARYSDENHFDEAVEALLEALHTERLEASVKRRLSTFLDVEVSDPQDPTWPACHMELGVDYRFYPPTVLSVGPVLDVRDAAANKLCALYGRAMPRDFIDAYNTEQSGLFTRSQVLALADQHEANPIYRKYLASSLRSCARIAFEDFAEYEIDTATYERIKTWAATFADEIEAGMWEPEATSIQAKLDDSHKHVADAPTKGDAPAAASTLSEHRDALSTVQYSRPASAPAPVQATTTHRHTTL